MAGLDHRATPRTYLAKLVQEGRLRACKVEVVELPAMTAMLFVRGGFVESTCTSSPTLRRGCLRAGAPRAPARGALASHGAASAASWKPLFEATSSPTQPRGQTRRNND